MPSRYYKTKCRLCKQYKMTKSGFSYCFECWEKSKKKDPEDLVEKKVVKKPKAKKPKRAESKAMKEKRAARLSKKEDF